MININKVVLIGRLTKDPEIKFMPSSGTANTKFTIAVNRKFKNSEGNYEADFINCVAWGKTAEIIANHFSKGSEIGIEGSIRTGSYDDKEGRKVYTTDINVDGFDFVGSKGTAGNTNDEDLGTPMDDSDMPF